MHKQNHDGYPGYKKMTSEQLLKNSFSSYTYQEIFKSLFYSAVHLGHPAAIWKLPQEKYWHLIIGENSLKLSSPEIEKLGPGFIVNAFEDTGTKSPTFIKGDLYFSSKLKGLEELTISNDGPFTERFLSSLKNTLKKGWNLQKDSGAIFFKEDDFRERVKMAVEEIRLGRFQKVVLSRTKDFLLPEQYDLIDLFEKLSSAYENAFTSLVFLPEKGIWMGASPETLISVKENIFKTSALAGTQACPDEVNLREVQWTHKEIEEQALVTRYIINCFKKIRIREYLEEGPKTIRAGNLLHLRTDFTVNMDEISLPQLGSIMLDLLHPTSAVCGMPHGPAFEFILKNEAFARELYAGFLGPVNIQKNTHLFVNLRCMKIINERAILFAGAGITEDSFPEKEWNETEIKFKTLLNVILK